MLGAGAVDHLDALDHRQVDGVALAGAVAQRGGLRHAVDHHQRLATAEGLAGAGHLLPAGRVGGDQVAQYLAVVAGDGQLLFDLLAGDDGDLLRRLACLAVGAGRTDGGGFQFYRVFLGENGSGQHGQGNGQAKRGSTKHLRTAPAQREIMIFGLRTLFKKGIVCISSFFLFADICG
ncbi:hypothetical protein D3C81_1748910 [compost metagenome]